MWGSGNQATFNLECRNGQAYIKMETHLGHPAKPHFHPHPPPQQQALHPGNHDRDRHKSRHKSPRHIQRDRARAAAHHTRLDQQLAVSATDSLDKSATGQSQSNETSSEEPGAATDVETSFTQPQSSLPLTTPQPEPDASSGFHPPVPVAVPATSLSETEPVTASDAATHITKENDVTIVTATAVL